MPLTFCCTSWLVVFVVVLAALRVWLVVAFAALRCLWFFLPVVSSSRVLFEFIHSVRELLASRVRCTQFPKRRARSAFSATPRPATKAAPATVRTTLSRT